MRVLARPVALAPARFAANPRSRRDVRRAAASYDALSGYQKNRMSQAKTDADWAAIEKDQGRSHGRALRRRSGRDRVQGVRLTRRGVRGDRAAPALARMILFFVIVIRCMRAHDTNI
jgi:hypothetical protein